MDAAAVSHPTPGQLRDFVQGRLAPADQTAVEGHLETCPECASVLGQLSADPLERLVRAAGPAQATTLPQGALGEGPTPPPAGAAGLPAALANHPRYRVVQLLGKGGMGEVYKAEHLLMERPVALKVLAPALADRPGLAERFHREVKAAAKLDHPNIVRAFDAEQAGASHFLVMEYVEGTDLARLVKAKGPLPVRIACAYVRQAALGLQHAHEQGLVHRDLKPHNLMVTPKGRVKILDFGLAKLRQADTPAPADLTGSGLVMGTPDYLAPEQATDASRADVRSDIYALGCTLYHLLTGRPPFSEGSVLERLLKHATERPTPPEQLRPDLPAGLAPVLGRMMHKLPDRRFQTPAEVARALEPFCQPPSGKEPPVPASRQPSREAAATTTEARPAPRIPARSRWTVGGMILLIVALLGTIGGLVHLAGEVIRITTPEGTVEVESEDPEVQVLVLQGGRQVEVLHPRSKTRVVLKAGQYEVQVAEQDRDHAVLVSGATVTVKQGEKAVVTVRRLMTAPGVVRRMAWQGDPKHVPYFTSFSPDGQTVFAASDAYLPEGGVRAWDVATGRERFRLRGCEAALVVPDGRQVLTNCPDKYLRFWDAATGAEVRRFAAHPNWAAVLDVTRDGRWALTGCNDGVARVWEMATGRLLREIPGHQAGAYPTGAFAPDGKTLMTAGKEGIIRLWDTATGELRRQWDQGEGALYSIQFHRDGKGFYARKGRRLACWQVAEDVPAWQVVLDHEVGAFGITPDGTRALVEGTGDRTIRCLALPSGVELARYTLGDVPQGTVDFTRDGQLAAVAAGQGVFLLRLPPPAAPAETAEVWRSPVQNAHLHHVAYSPDGRLIFHGGDRPNPSRGVARLSWAANGQVFREWQYRLAPAGTFTPDGRQLLIYFPGEVANPGGMELVDVATGQVKQRFPNAPPALFAAIAPDGRQALTGGADQTLRLWDLTTGAEVRHFELGAALPCGAFLADDRQALVGVGREVRLLDLTTGAVVRRFEGHAEPVEGLCPWPDGSRFAAWDRKMLRVWGMETGQEVTCWPLPADRNGLPSSLAVHPGTGRFAVARFPEGNPDQRGLEVFDLSTGKPMVTHPGGGTNGVAFAPDGRFFVGSWFRQSLRLFRLPPPQEGTGNLPARPDKVR